jgi:hypothetical protein
MTIGVPSSLNNVITCAGRGQLSKDHGSILWWPSFFVVVERLRDDQLSTSKDAILSSTGQA